MRKFKFDPSAATGFPDRPGVSLREAQPFVLDDAFRPVAALNDWLADLPSHGCHAPSTWSAYADDLIAWTRFLRRLNLDLLDEPDALRKAVSKYRGLRLQGEGGLDVEFGLLGGDAWDRAISAIDKFYAWAVEMRLIATVPFRYRTIKCRGGERTLEVQENLAKAKTGSQAATVRSLASDWADLFVDVGLGGLLRSGASDPDFRGRSSVRNRAIGSLVRSSGLRRAEFSNLLVWEIPDPVAAADAFVGIDVPAAISKRSKSRSTWASSRALDRVADYVGLERELAVSTSSWAPTNPLVVTEPGRRGGRVNGKRVVWANLSIPLRRRLVGPDGGSALLFVRSDGAPPQPDAWRSAFSAASARCQRLDPRFPNVTPHMLRHTFALETLNLLTRNSMTRARRLAMLSNADPVLMSVLRRNDPLLILRDMLGHESIKTTEKYLKAQSVTGIFTDAELELLEADDDRSLPVATIGAVS